MATHPDRVDCIHILLPPAPAQPPHRVKSTKCICTRGKICRPSTRMQPLRRLATVNEWGRQVDRRPPRNMNGYNSLRLRHCCWSLSSRQSVSRRYGFLLFLTFFLFRFATAAATVVVVHSKYAAPEWASCPNSVQLAFSCAFSACIHAPPTDRRHSPPNRHAVYIVHNFFPRFCLAYFVLCKQ